MFRAVLLTGFTSCLLPTLVFANPPKVAVDIAPVHSIVSQVMEGVGHPDLLIQPEASPHSYSLRPSEAEALSEADVVFWVSEELTPWLKNSMANLAGSATKVEMLEMTATIKHEYRDGGTFEAHDHADESDHHEEQEGHHDDDHHAEADEHHHHGADDPHAWLDPVNAKLWAKEIAQILSEHDVENADAYRKNARSFGQSMDELRASLDERAHNLEGIRFIVFHDAYQYFEQRFGLTAAGAIALSDASDPSPARIREIQATVSELGVTCSFTEPQYNPGLLDTVFENTEVKTIGVMDPLGADIEVGSDHYIKLLNQLMTSLETCKSQA
ncbi:zinc ABC transporter substrate-binding protein [Marinobacter sp.]|uniref:zinc ABC transporter substrate-binding protein n=1 Tax=Marinobacter sp. TaxID=50741 RepID=UPI002B271412|nr:zinc ABC transporter substrate-binding protein [Marinobacter sp.]